MRTWIKRQMTALAARMHLRTRSFVVREDGTITIFGLIMFVLMIGIGGIAVDVMRYETQRVQLQNTVDRAVLAAASLNQTISPEVVVNNYFQTSGLQNYRLNIDLDEGLNYRRVTVQAEAEINSLFMQMFGIRRMTSPAVGAAEERVPNIEISLVLDVSGSMRFTDSDGMMQIARLRPAAQDFVTRLLEGERAEKTTISVVPYAGQVNPGATVFNLMGGQRANVEYVNGSGDTVVALRDSPRSSCLEFTPAEFNLGAAPSGRTFPQVPHFMNWSIDNGTMDWGWCPLQGDSSAGDASSSIEYLSSDATHLNGFLERMRLHDGTGTHVGMLWGLWLLDPNSGWLVDELITAGIVDTDYTERPAAFDDPETLKVIVLMTDGNITDQYRPRFPNRTVAPLNETALDEIFLHHTEELAQQNNSNDCNGQGCRLNQSGRSTNVARFYASCNRARDNGITVFAIAFNANNSARQEMQNCATSDAHYYDVRGADLGQAFQSIASTIQMLRLVQ